MGPEVKRDLPARCYRKGRKGHVYYYPHGARGKGYRIHAEPGTPAFHAELAKAALGTLPTPLRTVRKLVDHYTSSDRWGELAANTRRSYARHFAYFVEVIGNIDPARLRTVDVVRMRDALKDTPTDASRKVGALVTLLNYARLIGWVKENVAHDVPKLKGKRPPREPWPAEMIDAYRKEADGLALLIFEMCLGTGQRIGDVLVMTWADVTPDGIKVKQSKTKARLTIPPTSRLAAILDDTPRLGLTIVAQPNGRRVSYSYAAKLVSDARKRIGAEAWDIHSLRHSAASEIAALPGMTDEHVQSITGHSSVQMVRLYAGAARQKARAKEAQNARGQNGTEK
jgi:integrase